jgi:hypothetical protein
MRNTPLAGIWHEARTNLKYFGYELVMVTTLNNEVLLR